MTTPQPPDRFNISARDDDALAAILGAVVAMDDDPPPTPATKKPKKPKFRLPKDRFSKHKGKHLWFEKVQVSVNKYVNENTGKLSNDNWKKWFHALGQAVATTSLQVILTSQEQKFSATLKGLTGKQMFDKLAKTFDKFIKIAIRAIMQTMKTKWGPDKINTLLQGCVHASCSAIWSVEAQFRQIVKKAIPNSWRNAKNKEAVLRWYCLEKAATFSGMYASNLIQNHKRQCNLITRAAAEECCRCFDSEIDNYVSDSYQPMPIVATYCAENQAYCNYFDQLRCAMFAVVFAVYTSTASDGKFDRAVSVAAQILYYVHTHGYEQIEWKKRKYGWEFVENILIDVAMEGLRKGSQIPSNKQLDDAFKAAIQSKFDYYVENDAPNQDDPEPGYYSGEEHDKYAHPRYEHNGSNRKGDANAPKQQRNAVPSQSEIDRAHGTLRRANQFGHFTPSKTQPQSHDTGPQDPRTLRQSPPPRREGKRQGGMQNGAPSRRVHYQHHGAIHGRTPKTEHHPLSKAAQDRHKEKGKEAAKRGQEEVDDWMERGSPSKPSEEAKKGAQPKRDAARQQSPPRTRKATTNRAKSPSAAPSERSGGAAGEQAAPAQTSPHSEASRGRGAGEAQRAQQPGSEKSFDPDHAAAGSEQSHVSDSDEYDPDAGLPSEASGTVFSEKDYDDYDPDSAAAHSDVLSLPSNDAASGASPNYIEYDMSHEASELIRQCRTAECYLSMWRLGGKHLVSVSHDWKQFLWRFDPAVNPTRNWENTQFSQTINALIQRLHAIVTVVQQGQKMSPASKAQYFEKMIPLQKDRMQETVDRINNIADSGFATVPTTD